MRCLLLITVAACGGDGDGFGSAGGGSDGGEPAGCEADWVEVEGYTVDPDTCLAWSARSAEKLSWHEAVDAQDAAAGGCAGCDEDESSWCAGLEHPGGRGAWRVPDLEELEVLAVAAPPFEELEGQLWSRSANGSANAWTVDLSQPGMSVSQDRDIPNHVRCVSDP